MLGRGCSPPGPFGSRPPNSWCYCGERVAVPAGIHGQTPVQEAMHGSIRPPPRHGDGGLPRGGGNPDPPSRSGGLKTGRWRKERRALPGDCLLLGAVERSARIRG